MGEEAPHWVAAIHELSNHLVAEITGDWADPFAPFVRDYWIPRRASAEVFRAFQSGKRMLVVQGPPLSGKSSVLRELVETTGASTTCRNAARAESGWRLRSLGQLCCRANSLGRSRPTTHSNGFELSRTGQGDAYPCGRWRPRGALSEPAHMRREQRVGDTRGSRSCSGSSPRASMTSRICTTSRPASRPGSLARKTGSRRSTPIYGGSCPTGRRTRRRGRGQSTRERRRRTKSRCSGSSSASGGV